MLLFIFFGAVSLAAGVLFLFFPETLKKLNDGFSKTVDKAAVSIDNQILRWRVGIGVSCFLLSIVCFFLVYWVIKKHG